MNDEQQEEKEITQVEQLLSLFEEREQLYAVGTSRIVEKLGPTALAAIYEFFNVDSDAIHWISFDIRETVLLIAMMVSYKNTDRVPAAIERLSPVSATPEDGTVSEVQRLMRIGIPFHFLFKDKDEIVKFMSEHIAKQTLPERPPPTIFKNRETGELIPAIPASEKVVSSDFDNTKLSKDQLAQLMMNQYQTKATKH